MFTLADWLPRALSLAASGPKLYTDHNDRLLLQNKIRCFLFACLLDLLSFAFVPVSLLILFAPQEMPFPPMTYYLKKDFPKKGSF